MKINNSIIRSVLALFTFAFIISGCKKDNDETPLPTPTPEQNLKMHIHTLVGSNVATYGVQYQDASGRKFTLSDFRYYISKIVLIKNDGSEYPINGKVLLVNPAQEDYDLVKVPVGSYKGFKFIVGLDSATNHSDPTTYSASDPLSIQSPGIHWSWSSGYIFMKIDGQVDTSFASTGTPDYDFFYHIGMDGFDRTIDFSTEAFSVVSGSDKELVVQFNLLDALDNIDMRTENATHTMDNMMLATKIADNWVNAFSIQ